MIYLQAGQRARGKQSTRRRRGRMTLNTGLGLRCHHFCQELEAQMP